MRNKNLFKKLDKTHNQFWFDETLKLFIGYTVGHQNENEGSLNIFTTQYLKDINEMKWSIQGFAQFSTSFPLFTMPLVKRL